MRLSYKQWGYKQALLPLALLFSLCYSSTSSAGTWTQPTYATETLNSSGIKVFNLLPSGPQGIFTGNGQFTVVHDNPNAAFVQDGKDTINTEITKFLLVGSVDILPGIQAEIQAGYGNTFFTSGVGLDHTRGQIQDLASSPDGVIDFSAQSIFDVFFDLWIDTNNDTVVDLGEVFSNDITESTIPFNFSTVSYALRMEQPQLSHIPPYPGTVYTAIGGIPHIDLLSTLPKLLNPEIGTNQAPTSTWPYLYAIDANRHCLDINCPPFAQVSNTFPSTHTVPEPSTPYLLSIAIGLFGYSRRKTVFRSNMTPA